MEVLIYIPENKVPKNLGGCSVEINFCGGHVSQVVMVDRYDEEGLDFTELPKGHGRLIDADALVDSLSSSDRDIYCKAVIEEEAPTIIEADCKSEE